MRSTLIRVETNVGYFQFANIGIDIMLKSIKNILRKVPFLASFWEGAYRLKCKLFDIHPVRYFDLDLQNIGPKLGKKALLSYIVHPFSISRDDPRFFQHINVQHAQEIVRILNEMGYAVDVID